MQVRSFFITNLGVQMAPEGRSCGSAQEGGVSAGSSIDIALDMFVGTIVGVAVHIEGHRPIGFSFLSGWQNHLRDMGMG